MGHVALTVIVIVALTAGGLALPRGFTAFFGGDECPVGWKAMEAARGRLILSVTDPKAVGVTVGKPLQDQEDREHQHGFSTEVVVPVQEVAAIDCCNNQGAHQGTYPIHSATALNPSGYPFTQMLLCTLESNDNSTAGYGMIGYFEPSVQVCPPSWRAMENAAGRFLIPAYERGGPYTNPAAPLKSGEDRKHSHSFSVDFPTQEVSYAGVKGCCNKNTAKYQTLTLAGTAETASTELPYVQLLTCVSQSPSFNVTLPLDAAVFSVISCPPGWYDVSTVSGRMLVALPDDGLPGASFGGRSIPPVSPVDPVHHHGINGTLHIPSAGVGLASGCCASGYAKSLTYGYNGWTRDTAMALPYAMVPLCARKGSKLWKSFHGNK